MPPYFNDWLHADNVVILIVPLRNVPPEVFDIMYSGRFRERRVAASTTDRYRGPGSRAVPLPSLLGVKTAQGSRCSKEVTRRSR